MSKGFSGSEDNLDRRITAGLDAVASQVDFLHAHFGRVESDWKSDGSRVTFADIAISQEIFRRLRGLFPEDQFFSEEMGETEAATPVTARHCWVLDPIDGTNNFALGLPHCAIGLALLVDGMPVYGFIYDMARRTLMHGGSDRGAFDGGSRATLRKTRLTGQSIVGFHSPNDMTYAAHASIVAGHYKMRALGSSMLHLAYVANGLCDAVVDHNVKVWDIAAAMPLVLASGGSLRFVTENPFPLRQFDLSMPPIFYVAGTPENCDTILGLLNV